MNGFKEMVPKECKVIRDGAANIVNPAELVPGDLVEFQVRGGWMGGWVVTGEVGGVGDGVAEEGRRSAEALLVHTGKGQGQSYRAWGKGRLSAGSGGEGKGVKRSGNATTSRNHTKLHTYGTTSPTTPQEGDQVPADIRVIDSYNLKVDNASLTGGSGRPSVCLPRVPRLDRPCIRPRRPQPPLPPFHTYAASASINLVSYAVLPYTRVHTHVRIHTHTHACPFHSVLVRAHTCTRAYTYTQASLKLASAVRC